MRAHEAAAQKDYVAGLRTSGDAARLAMAANDPKEITAVSLITAQALSDMMERYSQDKQFLSGLSERQARAMEEYRKAQELEKLRSGSNGSTLLPPANIVEIVESFVSPEKPTVG